MSEKFQNSINSTMHFQLARLEGAWEGTAKVWFEHYKPVDEIKITAFNISSEGEVAKATETLYTSVK